VLWVTEFEVLETGAGGVRQGVYTDGFLPTK